MRLPLLLSICTLLFVHTALGQGSPRWQQHVRYEIDVTMDVERHQMEGTQQLTYINNSPDTLRQVFYHLYFNAFNPNSMMAQRNRELPDPDGRIVPRIWELGPDEIGYHEIDALSQNGQPVSFEITDTVVRVTLAEPILPGDSAVLSWKSQSVRTGKQSAAP